MHAETGICSKSRVNVRPTHGAMKLISCKIDNDWARRRPKVTQIKKKHSNNEHDSKRYRIVFKKKKRDPGSPGSINDNDCSLKAIRSLSSGLFSYEATLSFGLSGNNGLRRPETIRWVIKLKLLIKIEYFF
jgi:hypothetical protein